MLEGPASTRTLEMAPFDLSQGQPFCRICFILHQPEIRRLGSSSAHKPPFGVRSGEVFLIHKVLSGGQRKPKGQPQLGSNWRFGLVVCYSGLLPLTLCFGLFCFLGVPPQKTHPPPNKSWGLVQGNVFPWIGLTSEDPFQDVFEQNKLSGVTLSLTRWA